MELILELGFPELPATVVAQAEEELLEALSHAVREELLAAGELTARSYSTPRRLAVVLSPLRERQPDREVEVRGPSVRAAFGEDGSPTPAALGFARGQGVRPEDLMRRETPQGEYVFARRSVSGRDAAQVLGEIVQGVAKGLHFPKAMRWAGDAPRLPRPLGWILCRLGDEVVPVSIGPIAAGGETFGHRVLAPGPHEVTSAEHYPEVLRGAFVEPDRQKRLHDIADGVQAAAAAEGLRAEAPADLLEEVADLCEWPQAFMGRFDEEYLAVPEAVLAATMIHHQRFFPVRDAAGRLAPRFCAVRNGGEAEVVRRGNETVLRARLADALFFFREDRKLPLAERRQQLRGIAYAPGLGTLFDRSERLSALAGRLCALLGDEAGAGKLRRAGEIALCDRATALVRELPELEGLMGAEYLRLEGEDEEICRAVGERVRPRGADDDLPAGRLGLLLALADRLDQLVGFLALGRSPSGSQDPFGLRRAAIGALRIWQELSPLPLEPALDAAVEGYRGLLGERADRARDAVREFLGARLFSRGQELGYDPRQLQAVLEAGISLPGEVLARAEALRRVAGGEEFTSLVHAARRARNLAQEGEAGGAEGPEAQLLAAVEELERLGDELLGGGDYEGYLRNAAKLYAPLGRFFEDVLVMSEDPAERRRRRAILWRAHRALSRVAEIASLSAD